MSEPQQVSTPEEVKEVNNANRRVATRPGWIAVVAFLVFVGGLAAFMFKF